MDRLKSALESAEPAAGSGVVSERSASSRLLEPAEPGAPYTAEVTIHTVVAVAEPPAKAPPNGAGGKANVQPTGDDDSRPPEPPPIARDEVYELVFKGDRWELATELTSEQSVERLAFQYALE